MYCLTVWELEVHDQRVGGAVLPQKPPFLLRLQLPVLADVLGFGCISPTSAYVVTEPSPCASLSSHGCVLTRTLVIVASSPPSSGVTSS